MINRLKIPDYVLLHRPMFYADQVLNPALCLAFTKEMALLGDDFLPMAKETVSSSTDMGSFTTLRSAPQIYLSTMVILLIGLYSGNVSHVVPSFHCSYGIYSGGASNHTAGFTAAAATPDALARAIRVGKGLAMLGIHLLHDDDFSQRVTTAFESAK